MNRLREIAAHLADCGWVESWHFLAAAWGALIALAIGGVL